MALNPTETKSTSNEDFKDILYPHPEAGNQMGRISLIVDLGVQEREYDGKPINPAQQLAFFADLTDQVVDYGGMIGEQPYRLMLNSEWDHKVLGTTFTSNARDGNPARYASGSIITKLAAATGTTDITEGINLDVEQLLGKGCMFNVEVQASKPNDKYKNEDGTHKIFHNVRFKGASPCVKYKGEVMEPEPLKMEPMVITFDNVTEESAKYIRKAVKDTIKMANNYGGSKMQEVFEKLEASRNTNSSPKAQETPEQTQSAPAVTNKQDDWDDDIPF